MPNTNLAGTPFRRYPDPLIKRVNPNGTQAYSAYDGLFTYYDPRPDDPTLAGYQFVLADLPKSNASIGPLSGIDIMLFGTDYPALIQTVSTYVSDSYTSNGAVYPILLPTFDESTLTAFGTSQVGFTFNLRPPDGFGSLLSDKDYYQRIFTGRTVTNNVALSGFAVRQGVQDHGLYAGFTPPAQPEFLAPLSLNMRVLTNTPVVYSTNTYVQITAQINNQQESLSYKFRQPVILWEPNLTQEIVDNGFVIEDTTTVCGPTLLDVVGIWRLQDYSPLYVPKAVQAGARMAAVDGAEPVAESTQADRHDAAKASLLSMAAERVAGISSEVQKAIGKKRSQITSASFWFNKG